jgi:hypothetical protein
LFIPIFVIVFWLHGKRNIVAMAIMLLIFSLWRRGSLNGYRIYLAGFIALLIMFSFSHIYQSRFRFTHSFSASRTWLDWYKSARIDFSRDDVLKLEILALLKPKIYKILDYPGQSFLLYLTAPIPRYFWPDKPASYPYYLTSAAKRQPLKAKGGALTTTCLGEAISNFGGFGFLIGPLILILIAEMQRITGTETGYGLCLMFLTLIQSTHLIAFLPIAAFTLAYCLFTYLRRIK